MQQFAHVVGAACKEFVDAVAKLAVGEMSKLDRVGTDWGVTVDPNSKKIISAIPPKLIVMLNDLGICDDKLVGVFVGAVCIILQREVDDDDRSMKL